MVLEVPSGHTALLLTKASCSHVA